MFSRHLEFILKKYGIPFWCMDDDTFSKAVMLSWELSSNDVEVFEYAMRKFLIVIRDNQNHIDLLKENLGMSHQELIKYDSEYKMECLDAICDRINFKNALWALKKKTGLTTMQAKN